MWHVRCVFNYPGNAARCSITLAMAVIKSSKIFISIRHPHATCIINVYRKDAATSSHTHAYKRVRAHPSAALPTHFTARRGSCGNGSGSVGRSEVNTDCVAGRRWSAYSADVLCCSCFPLRECCVVLCFRWGKRHLEFCRLLAGRRRRRFLWRRLSIPCAPLSGRLPSPQWADERGVYKNKRRLGLNRQTSD